jgi:hypothetical protein
MIFDARSNPVFSMSPAPSQVPSFIMEEVDASDQPIEVQKMQAELEVAEAELKAARLKHQYLQAKEQAEKEMEAKYHSKPKAKGTPQVYH